MEDEENVIESFKANNAPLTTDCDAKFETPCPQCDRIFYSERSLRCHLKVHNEKTLKCRNCPLTFNRLDTFFYHVTDHYIAKTNSFECYVKDCDKVVPSIFEGEKHICDDHLVENQTVLNCKDCGKVCLNFRKLFSHFLTKHGELKDYVEEITKMQRQMLSRKKNEKRKLLKNGTKFEAASFIQNDEFEMESIFEEKYANKSSSEKFDAESAETYVKSEQEKEMISRLKEAITPSNGESNSDVLERLSDFVTTVFPSGEDDSFYQCAHCGLGFLDSILWMAHLSFHSDDNPFKCSFCSKVFENRQTFVIHLTYFAHGGKD